MKNQTVMLALIAATTFVVVAILGLVALGRDITQVLYLIGSTIPGAVGSIFAYSAGRKAHETAGEALAAVEQVQEAQATNAASIAGGVADLRAKLEAQ